MQPGEQCLSCLNRGIEQTKLGDYLDGSGSSQRYHPDIVTSICKLWIGIGAACYVRNPNNNCKEYKAVL